MYLWTTGKTNCRKHLIARHPVIYDKTVLEKNWPYRLSTESPESRITIGELRKRALPQFSLQSFIDYLVRFIVADDQVINLFPFLSHVLTSS
jgi:hypothetical protein